MDIEEKYPSPTGKYLFRIYPWEARMSLWIETPELIEHESGASLLRLRNANWSLDEAVWNSDSAVIMHLRKYPGDHHPASLRVVVDCERGQAQIEGSSEFPLEELEAGLEAIIAKR